jgi:hypothetical protein
VHGLVAEWEDQPAGLAHLGLHPTMRATHPTCYLEDLYAAKPWGRRDVARRLIEAVYAFADRFGPAAVYWLTQEYNAPGTLPVRHPRLSDIFRLLPALSLAGRFRGVRPRPPAPRPSRCLRPAEIAVFAGLPQVHLSTPKRESQRQSRYSSPTEINAGCRAHVQGRVSTWPARTPSWACNRLTAVSRRVRRSTRMPARRNIQGGGRARSEV